VLRNLTKAVSLFSLLFVSVVNGTYVYEANQSLFDLTNETGTTNLASGDDQVSSTFNLDFTFTFYGEDFTSARMATNGCLHFKTTGAYCNDYTPDPLPEITYTLYPFWTDLIRDSGSKVLAKNFTDKTVFGWYDMREYNRSNTDNSFEVVLWKSDDSFEYRYGGLNIIKHDVLIGEQGNSSQTYTYLYHDECSTGTTNVSGVCVNTDWNNTSSNTLLENGGSLYGLGSGNALDCSNPLNNSACAGYDAAYLTQQCTIDSLYSSQCPYYWDALFDEECDFDPQSDPSCPGYSFESSYAYYNQDEYDYGIEDEYIYDEETYFDEGFYEDTYIDDEYFYEEEYFFEATQEEVYFLPEEFADDMVFDDFEYIEEFYDYPIDEGVELYLETIPADEFVSLAYIEDEFLIYDEPLLAEYALAEYDLPFIDDVLMDHFEHEQIVEEIEEYFEEEIEEELFVEEVEEELIDEEEIIDDDEETEEVELFADDDKKERKRERQLSVVAQTIKVAASSYSVTNNTVSAQTSSGSGYSVAQNNSLVSGGASNPQSTAVASSVSGGISGNNNSPSISDQVSSSAAQTQQVLSMSAGADSSIDSSSVSVVGANTDSADSIGSDASVDVSIMPMMSFDANQPVMADVQIQDMQGQISNATSGVMTASEADQIADQIIADNIKEQQQEIKEQEQQSGEYADSSTLIALMGYVPGFSDYSMITLPKAATWYETTEIYANVSLSDNNQAFTNMFGNNLTMMRDMVQSQPKL
jgi:hypothetical protein